MVKEEEKKIISFIETVKVLKKRYKKHFIDMTIFMSFKNKKHSFIFQQLNTFPLTSIIADKKKFDLLFLMKWSSSGRFNHKMPENINILDSGQVSDWSDIPDREDIKLLHNVKDFSSSSELHNILSINLRKKLLVGSNNFSSNMKIRINGVNNIKMYSWGFEIISETISMTAVKDKIIFPYKKINNKNIQEDDRTVDFTGSSFIFNPQIENEEIKVVWNKDCSNILIDNDVSDFIDDFLESDDIINNKNIGQRDLSNIDI